MIRALHSLNIRSNDVELQFSNEDKHRARRSPNSEIIVSRQISTLLHVGQRHTVPEKANVCFYGSLTSCFTWYGFDPSEDPEIFNRRLHLAHELPIGTGVPMHRGSGSEVAGVMRRQDCAGSVWCRSALEVQYHCYVFYALHGRSNLSTFLDILSFCTFSSALPMRCRLYRVRPKRSRGQLLQRLPPAARGP